MGYDYDGAIETLKRFKVEKEAAATAAAEAGRHDIADMMRSSAAGYDETIAVCKAARDQQSE